MATKAQTLGKLELEVLKIVWTKPGCTVPEATEVLAARHGYARTTILTVIQRLHKKGFCVERKPKAFSATMPLKRGRLFWGSSHGSLWTVPLKDRLRAWFSI